MTARQQHGFDFQEQIIAASDGLFDPIDGYTAADDATCHLGKKDIKVSVKTKSKRGSACMSDMKRIVRNDDKTILIVGEHTGRERKLVGIKALYLPDGMTGLLGDAADEIVDMVDDFSHYMTTTDGFNSHEYDGEWKKHRTAFRKNYMDKFEDKPIITPAPKRDHKEQRRLQCAIPNGRFRVANEEYGIASVSGFVDGDDEGNERKMREFCKDIRRAVAKIA